MISALPAVFVRRAREKRKSSGGLSPPPNRQGRLAFLYQNRIFAHQSNTTIDSVQRGSGSPRWWHSMDKEEALFLIAGLLLMLIGVGLTTFTKVWAVGSIAQTVGLFLTGIGVVLCVIEMFCSETPAREIHTQLGRIFIYSGKIFLVVGLLLVLIGGGLNVFVFSNDWVEGLVVQTIGLIFTGIGVVFFIYSGAEAQASKITTVLAPESTGSREDNALDSDNTPVIENPDFLAIPK